MEKVFLYYAFKKNAFALPPLDYLIFKLNIRDLKPPIYLLPTIYRMLIHFERKKIQKSISINLCLVINISRWYFFSLT